MASMSVSTIVIPYHVQIYTHGSHYTCPIKEVNGEWIFRFKGEWYKVNDYVDEYTRTTKI